jgi:Ser/Thr protein kinase RdoA (MazF antagonist)
MKDVLTENYGLPSSISVAPVVRNERNDVYKVVNNETTFFFKVFTQYYEDRLKEEHRLITLLNEMNILSPVPVLTSSNALYVSIKKEDKIGVLYPKANGKEIEEQVSMLGYYKIGEIIGHIHNCFDKLPAELSKVRWNDYWLIDKPMETIAKIGSADRDKMDDLTEIAKTVKSSILEILRPERPQFGIIHADLHGGNIFVDHDGNIALIDFESFGYGYRYYDLVRFLYPEICLCLENDQIYNNNIDGFINGYNAIRAPVAISRRALNLFTVINIIRCLAGHIESGKYQTPSTEFEKALEDRIRKVRLFITKSRCLLNE